MSTLVITISGESLKELHAKVCQLAQELAGSAAEVVETPPAEKKAGKSAKNAKAAETAAVVSNGHANGHTTMFDDEPVAKVEAAPIKMASREQATAAAQKLMGKHGAEGIPVVRKVLAGFKVAKISELKDEHLAAFIQQCEAS